MEHTFGLDWDDIPESLTAVAAKPKGNRAPEEPTHQPMRPVQQIRNSPSSDQLKARKQMSRKQAASANLDNCPECGKRIRDYDMTGMEAPDGQRWCIDHAPEDIRPKKHVPRESAMRTEAQILREMAVASLADQRTLAEELDSVRRTRTASIQADRDVDLADTVVRAHLTPVRVHAMHTTATDWVDTEEPQGDPTLAMKTEATLWFGRTSAEVREDADEFATQATGMATRLASRHGDQADAAFEAFIGHVDHLYRQAAKVAKVVVTDIRSTDEPGVYVGTDSSGKEVRFRGDADDDSDLTQEDSLLVPDQKVISSKVALEADPSGQAQSNLPEPDDEDPYLSEDWDDEDTGVHPPMPGAGEKTSTKTASDEDGGSPWNRNTCGDCGAPIERDPAGESNRTWHHDDGEKHDHEASPGNKTSSLTAEAGEKVDEDDPATGVTGLPEPDDTEPYLAEDWQGDPPVPSGAADVKNADNPFDNSKSSMLDKAAAFRALVQSNLEK